MADEQVIIEVSYDTADAEKNIDKLTGSIVDLQKANNDLKESLKKGEISQTEYNKAVAENNEAMGKSTAQRKDHIKFIQSEANSIDALRAKNSALLKERNGVNTATKEGQARIKAINKEYDANNSKIKDNASLMEKQKMNIGNYASAMDKLPGSLGGVVSGMWGMVKASLAFIATPIGAIIAAVVVVVTALYSIFKNFQPLLDWIEQKIAAVAAVFNVLKDVAMALFTGQKNLNESFKGLGASMADAAQKAIALKKAQQELEDAQVRLIESQAKSKRQIDELLLQSKDRTKTEKERIALIEEALKIEEEAYNKKKDIADGLYEQALQQIAISNRLTEEQVNDIRTRGVIALQELQDTKAIADADVQKFAEASAEKESILNESLAIREKAINRQNALLDKAEEEEAKRIEASKKAKEEETKKAEEQFKLESEATLKKMQEEQAIIDAQKAYLEESEKLAENRQAKREQRILDRKKEAAQKEAEIEKKKQEEIEAQRQQSAQTIVQAYLSISQATAAFFASEEKSVKGFFKMLIGSLIDQVQAVIIAANAKILAESLSGPLSIATFGAAGVAKAAGIIALTTAAGAGAKAGLQSLGEGGELKMGTFGGRYHTQGGNNLYDGSGRLVANVERDENFYVMKRDASAHINALSRMNESFGGRSFGANVSHAANGGMIGNQQVQGLTANDVQKIIKSTPIVVQVSDIMGGINANAKAQSIGVI